MVKAYPLDIRDQVVAHVLAGQPVRAVAAIFGVSVASVVKWSKRFRATGSAAPGKIGGHRRKVIVGEHRDWLLARIAEGDFTLRGLVTELAARGLKVDYRTIWNFFRDEGLNASKNRRGRRAGRPLQLASPESVEALH